jgi:putative effector of murein hydrolase LrgA (UPF0299 family)
MSKSSKREARWVTAVLTLLVLPAIVFSVVPDTAVEWWLNIVTACVLGVVVVFLLFVLVRSYLQ